MAQTQNNVAAERASRGQAGAQQQNPAAKGVIVLNALPLNALPRSHLRLDVTTDLKPDEVV